MRPETLRSIRLEAAHLYRLMVLEGLDLSYIREAVNEYEIKLMAAHVE